MRCVLNFWRAKDIPEVVENNEKLDIDQLIFKYIRQPKPQEYLKKFVEEGWLDDYDYLIMTSTDLVVTPENLRLMLNDIERLNPPVIAGSCNVDLNQNKNNLASCWERVSTNKLDYKWIRKDSINGIHEVGFNGQSLMAIRKDVFKAYNFYDSAKVSTSADLRFCDWCHENDIPILVNFDNFMLHLRYTGQLLCGVKSPEIWFCGKMVVYQNDSLPKIEFEG